MLLKEKLLIVWVIAIVVLGFLATHAMHYVIEALTSGCMFGITGIVTVAGHLSTMLLGIWCM